MVLDNETLGISLSTLIGQQVASLVSANSCPPSVQTHMSGLTGAVAYSQGGPAGSLLKSKKSSTGHGKQKLCLVNS